MDAYIVEKTDKAITLGFKNANMTLIEPIIKALNDDKSVSAVRYIDEHPELSDILLHVEVNKGKPEDAVKKASKAVSAYFTTLKK
ncbi:MAG: DNA-directed RNA polymerase subunit L [Candidatus Methanoplasma sp.]|jgi:DNA-directed RNA polymerase subunit L|nr:DNA-directed RNA polymerase subunit L [Candidatus Methanoplasma sp.]